MIFGLPELVVDGSIYPKKGQLRCDCPNFSRDLVDFRRFLFLIKATVE